MKKTVCRQHDFVTKFGHIECNVCGAVPEYKSQLPKKPYPLTKKIGLAVLVITESIVLLLFCWAVYAEKMQESFDAAGYQMIIFASFWGVKAVADNIKAVRGKE